MKTKFLQIVLVLFCCLLAVILNLNGTATAQETGLCGGEISSNTIDPSRPSINALIIFTHFPNDPGNPGHDAVPPFAQNAADFVRDYYLSMSYGKHTVNAQVIQRPAPNQGLAFDASNTILYYRNRITELNTEILDAAWNENNNVFNDIDFIFMCYEGNIYVRGTARGRLLHNSLHYSGDGVTMEYWWGSGGEEVLKWHFAHEYGHQIALPGNSIIWDQYIYRRDDPDIIPGPYDIMYYVHGGGTPPMAAFHLNYLGWLEDSWIRDIDPSVDGDQPNQIIKDTRLAPSTGEYNAYRIEIPGTNEAFFIENRQGTSYDSELMGTGLIIWHVSGTTYPFSSAGQDVEIAVPDGPHGYDWLDNIPDGTSAGLGFATDFFNPTNKTQFTPWTNPSTETGYRFFDTHSFTDIAITNIRQNGSDMIFDFLANSPPAAPQNLFIVNAGSNGQHPVLQWDANTEPDLDHYNIYRGWQQSKTDPIDWDSFPAATTTNTTWTDPVVTMDISATTSVHYRVTAVDDADNESDYSNSVSTTTNNFLPKIGDDISEIEFQTIPKGFALSQNYPNPFNPTTEIKYQLPENGLVTLSIFNVVGQEIRTLVKEQKKAGYYSAMWDGKDDSSKEVASGIYLYRIQVMPSKTGGKPFAAVKKLTLMR